MLSLFKRHKYELVGQALMCKKFKGIIFECADCGLRTYITSNKKIDIQNISIKKMNTLGCRGGEGTHGNKK